jgi:hypothetical protein
MVDFDESNDLSPSEGRNKYKATSVTLKRQKNTKPGMKVEYESKLSFAAETPTLSVLFVVETISIDRGIEGVAATG